VAVCSGACFDKRSTLAAPMTVEFSRKNR